MKQRHALCATIRAQSRWDARLERRFRHFSFPFISPHAAVARTLALGETVLLAGGKHRMDEATRLALAARDGDRDALSEFTKQTQADVWRFCAHLAGHAHAGDLTQEVFARALRSLHAYRGDAAARLWLLAIARRACADHVRSEVRRRRVTERLLGDARRQGPRIAADTATAQGLTSVIEALAPDYRVAFTLTQVLGLSYAEAASVCDCPIGTIRSRVARARESIIAELDAAEDLRPEGTVGA
jgi:RNA polymerase sigma-70 factor, ECF subfamily